MLRVVFMGTPQFAVPTLSEVLGAGHEVVAVYSQPPRPAGRRGLEETPSPVHAFAVASGLTVLTPTSLKGEEAAERMRGHGADVAVVVAYGLLLPQTILDAPRFGCLNLHPSALPRWRGAAPLQRTLMAGDRETAVIVMRMEAGLDTGPICLREQVTLGDDMTAGQLHDEMARRGADLMVRALAALERGSLTETPQSDDGVTYAAKITKAEAEIDWLRPARELHDHVRGLSPAPGAFFTLETGGKSERVKVLLTEVAGDVSVPDGAAPGTLLGDDFAVATGEGALRVLRGQRAGKQPMSGVELLRGLPVSVGERLM